MVFDFKQEKNFSLNIPLSNKNESNLSVGKDEIKLSFSKDISRNANIDIEAEAKSLKEFLKKPKVNLQIRKIF